MATRYANELPAAELEPFVLWQSYGSSGEPKETIIVDAHLAKFLTQQQRDGIQCIFECVTSLRGTATSAGWRLADDTRLGIILQSITLIWTVLKQGFDSKPMAKRVVIITPTNLVSTWEQDIAKWLNHSTVNVLAVSESTRENGLHDISTFLSPHSFYQVLIMSYENFLEHASCFEKEGNCDLLICNEVERLEHDEALTEALASLPCFRKHVLLSGAPIEPDAMELDATYDSAGELSRIKIHKFIYIPSELEAVYSLIRCYQLVALFTMSRADSERFGLIMYDYYLDGHEFKQNQVEIRCLLRPYPHLLVGYEVFTSEDSGEMRMLDHDQFLYPIF